jgi:hypothetical protein
VGVVLGFATAAYEIVMEAGVQAEEGPMLRRLGVVLRETTVLPVWMM